VDGFSVNCTAAVDFMLSTAGDNLQSLTYSALRRLLPSLHLTWSTRGCQPQATNSTTKTHKTYVFINLHHWHTGCKRHVRR